jgi:protein gp37
VVRSLLSSQVWLGVSVEAQWYADERSPLLVSPAAHRLLSVEPLLGRPVYLHYYPTR